MKGTSSCTLYMINTQQFLQFITFYLTCKHEGINENSITVITVFDILTKKLKRQIGKEDE